MLWVIRTSPNMYSWPPPDSKYPFVEIEFRFMKSSSNCSLSLSFVGEVRSLFEYIREPFLRGVWSGILKEVEELLLLDNWFDSLQDDDPLIEIWYLFANSKLSYHLILSLALEFRLLLSLANFKSSCDFSWLSIPKNTSSFSEELPLASF